MQASTQISLRRTILICALGYFIDVFDIQLFGIVRVNSLTDIGVSPDRITEIGGYILNLQMVGMVLGAFLWGWLGDRFGRLKALYGSILIYSLGTLACAFITDATTYGLLRFVTGFGLAGETGAAVTLIAEMTSTSNRTKGLIAASVAGQFGPFIATALSCFLPWRSTYLIAGAVGLLILFLRVRLSESVLFLGIAQGDIAGGNLKLFIDKRRLRIVLLCLMMGLPLTYFWFLLNFYSAEFARVILPPKEIFNPKIGFLFFYGGTASGNVLSGIASHFWQSRRKSLAAGFAVGSIAATILLMFGPLMKFSLPVFYMLYFLIGCAAGCWIIMSAIFAEHFGTNLRATATIVLSNLVRGLSIPMIFLFLALKERMGVIHAATLIGGLFAFAGFFALSRLRETHGLDLDYVERLEQKVVTTPN